MLGVGARAAYRSHRDTIDPEYSEMTTNILVTFYSTYGHVHRMALAVAEGAESVPDTTVRLRRIAELEEARKGAISPGRLCAGTAGTGRGCCRSRLC